MNPPGAFIAAKGAPFDGPPSLLRNKRIGIVRDSMHADWADKSFRRSAQLKRYDSTAAALPASSPPSRLNSPPVQYADSSLAR